MSGDHKKLIINPIGGLANRMRAIASGVALADKLDIDREIVWTCNSDLRCRFELLFENSELLPHIRYISCAKDLLFYDIPRKKNLYISSLTRKMHLDVLLSDYERLPEFLDNNDSLVGELAGARGNILIRSGLQFYDFDEELYRKLFVPRGEITEDSKRRVSFGNNRCIGLHIRRTDNDMSRKYSPLELFTDAVRREMAEDNSTQVYLASDDESVKNALHSEFGNRIICSEKPADRNTEEGIIEAFTEMVTLSMCDKIYGSYWSSFSEAAALIGNKQLIQLTKK